MKTLLLLLLLCLLAPAWGALEKTELVIYSARNESLLKPLVKAYESKTGTKIRYFTDKAPALVQKLLAEGDKTPADILLTVDAGNLYYAKTKDLFAKVEADFLKKKIPPHLRDADDRWFGLSLRARSIFYNKKKVKPEELKSYEALAQSKWKGRLCLRTSTKVYNKSLVATLLHHDGPAKTEQVIKGWVKNLAVPVFTSDTLLLKAIEAGQCDVGIANTYYYGRLVRDNKANNVGLFWPNQNGRGAHINVSGAGVIISSKHKLLATKFLEWLVTPEAQKIFVDTNFEFPVNDKVETNSIIRAMGLFKQDKVNLNVAGELQAKAVEIMDKAGYK